MILSFFQFRNFGFKKVYEIGRTQHCDEYFLDPVFETVKIVFNIFPKTHVAIQFAGIKRSPEGALHETTDDFLGIGFGEGFVGRIKKYIGMALGRPNGIVGRFKLHRFDEQRRSFQTAFFDQVIVPKTNSKNIGQITTDIIAAQRNGKVL